jgi:hypothetical protein
MPRSVETVYPVTDTRRAAVLQSLIDTARMRWGDDITRCSGKSSWDECLTMLPDGRMALWFNDSSNSTHIQTYRPVDRPGGVS